MNALVKTNRLELSIASSMQTSTADRIFNQGKAADGSGIGTYSDGYLKTRAKRGLSGSKVILISGEFQTGMKDDWSVINTGNKVGLGFKNDFNGDKSEWVEETYSKVIFDHTTAELAQIDTLVDKEVKKILNG